MLAIHRSTEIMKMSDIFGWRKTLYSLNKLKNRRSISINPLGDGIYGTLIVFDGLFSSGFSTGN